MAHHERVLLTFWNVRFLRTQSAPGEHRGRAHLVELRRLSRALLTPGDAGSGQGELIVQVGNLFTSDELARFGDDDLYEIAFIHGPDILVSSPRVTVDWTTRAEM